MERPMTRICGAMFLLLFRLPSLAMAVEWNAIIEAWELTQGIQWFLRGGFCEFLQRIISESWRVFGSNSQGTQGRVCW
jgi:hypothetical protein